jgi:hypothetical protein
MLLIEPLVTLLRYHIRRNWTPEPPAFAANEEKQETKRVTFVERGLWWLWLTLWAAFILGIVVRLPYSCFFVALEAATER